MYDFDKVINRKGTGCAKYDAAYTDDDQLVSMWVADMDFEVLPEIREAVIERAGHPIYGYPIITDEYLNCVVRWMKDRHDFHIEKEWIVCTGGVVPALKLAVQAFTKPKDHILIMKPVYYPFDDAIKKNDRYVVECPLLFDGEKYSLDPDLFEKKIAENDVKMFILCNPHNPLGIVWSKEDLLKLGKICQKYGVIVVSDEIHMDFVYSGYAHIPFYKVDPSFKDFSIICTAPSKTFNLAGLWTSNILIANETLRKQFEDAKDRCGVTDPNIFGIAACMAAYTYGDRWVDELIDYLQGNVAYMKHFFAENMPEVKVIDPQGLYLVWVDFRSLGFDKDQLEDFMLHKAHVWLDEGYIFGMEGAGFERFNVACPRSILAKALNQIKEAYNKIKAAE